MLELCRASAAALTHKEHRVLERLAEGDTTEKISAKLYMSSSTVGNYYNHIREKLGLDGIPMDRLVAVAARLIDKPKDQLPLIGNLTERQRQVFECLAEGIPPREIAEQLGISPKTVCTHSNRIQEKLGIPENHMRRLIAVASRLVHQ